MHRSATWVRHDPCNIPSPSPPFTFKCWLCGIWAHLTTQIISSAASTHWQVSASLRNTVTALERYFLKLYEPCCFTQLTLLLANIFPDSSLNLNRSRLKKITVVLFFLQSVVANICSHFSPTSLVQTEISKQLLDKLAMKCGFHSFVFVELLLAKIWLYNQIPPKPVKFLLASAVLCV